MLMCDDLHAWTTRHVATSGLTLISTKYRSNTCCTAQLSGYHNTKQKLCMLADVALVALYRHREGFLQELGMLVFVASGDCVRGSICTLSAPWALVSLRRPIVSLQSPSICCPLDFWSASLLSWKICTVVFLQSSGLQCHGSPPAMQPLAGISIHIHRPSSLVCQ